MKNMTVQFLDVLVPSGEDVSVGVLDFMNSNFIKKPY